MDDGSARQERGRAVIPLDYAALRLARRLLPERLVGWLRARRLFLVPGLETRAPDQAVARATEQLQRYQVDLADKRAMVLGYGGSFGVGIGLLRRGARQVTMVDPYVNPDDGQNERFLTEAPEFVRAVDEGIRPADERLNVRSVDACQLAREPAARFDVILSSSVLEHVVGLERLLGCLRQLTAPGGVGLHFVDLRDHFFKYPFEMLCHSDRVWRGLLEPTTRLNRLRLWQYEDLFEQNFARVELQILESEPEALARVAHRIRPEFLSGDPARDAATRLAIFCSVAE